MEPLCVVLDLLLTQRPRLPDLAGWLGTAGRAKKGLLYEIVYTLTHTWLG